MRVFVTGASGWIGSAVVPELLAAGHEVLGLARSEASAVAVTALGAVPVEGSLDDPDGLRAIAAAADGVVHLAYHHDFGQMAQAAEWDRAAIEALGAAMAPTGGLLLVASGLAGIPTGGGMPTEDDLPDPDFYPRNANATATLDLADRGVRSGLVRFAPTVHGEGDLGFVATLARIARERGFAGWVGDGANRWAAVHRADAAALVARAVDAMPARGIVHAVGEEGIATRAIAEALGRSLGVPAGSVPREQAAEHFGWIATFFGGEASASNALTRERYGWTPTHPGLIADIDTGYYPGTASHS